MWSSPSTPTGASTQLVITIPPIPVTEVLLAIIAVLLFRMCRLLKDIAHSNRVLAGLEPAVHRAPQLALPGSLTTDDGAPSPRASFGPGDTPQMAISERQRPLQLSAQLFEQALHGEEDVLVPAFIAACRNYCNVLNIIGPFTMLTVKEVHSNMAKIETSLELDSKSYRSMKALLKAEKATGMHQAGGVLTDPSAAMGLLWSRRGLGFWLEIYRQIVDPTGARVLSSTRTKSKSASFSKTGSSPPLVSTPGSSTPPDQSRPTTPPLAPLSPGISSSTAITSPAPASAGGAAGSSSVSLSAVSSPSGENTTVNFREVVNRAYEISCQPYNGFVTRHSFKLTLGVVPDWATIIPKLAPSEAEAREDLLRWVVALDQVLPRMEALHKALDLEDMRKSI